MISSILKNHKKYILLALGTALVLLLVRTLFWPDSTILSEKSPQNKPSFTPRLETEVLLEGLTKPWDVAELPDGTLLFTEKAGTISRISGTAKVVVGQVENVLSKGEAGLMGLAVDSEFTQNRYIYACYATDTDVRVGRWRLSTNYELSEKTDVISGIPLNTTTFPGRHSGCRPRFGPDGYLWVGTGDIAIGSHPQDPKSLAGKVLRVDRDGKPAEGNLGGAFDPRIYNYGHRNIQGLAFRKKDDGSKVIGYSLEHGSFQDDEVNALIRGNFGWNPIPGYNERVAMTDTTLFSDAIEAVWSSGNPTIAISGGSMVYGSSWGKYDGSLAVAVQKNKHIRMLRLDKTGEKVLGEDELFRDTFGRIRSIIQTASGDLLFSTDNGEGIDVIVRVRTR